MDGRAKSRDGHGEQTYADVLEGMAEGPRIFYRNHGRAITLEAAGSSIVRGSQLRLVLTIVEATAVLCLWRCRARPRVSISRE